LNAFPNGVASEHCIPLMVFLGSPLQFVLSIKCSALQIGSETNQAQSDQSQTALAQLSKKGDQIAAREKDFSKRRYPKLGA
jgi:hypothetical protein